MSAEIINPKTLEARARRIANHHGLRVEKARGRLHLNNRGQYQLINDYCNTVVNGDKRRIILTDG